MLDNALTTLYQQKQLEPFEWSNGLAQAARDHCNDIGRKGLRGHIGTDGSRVEKRVERYGKWEGNVDENIIMGKTPAAEYIYQLYVDDG